MPLFFPPISALFNQSLSPFCYQPAQFDENHYIRRQVISTEVNIYCIKRKKEKGKGSVNRRFVSSNDNVSRVKKLLKQEGSRERIGKG
jgi:hypothetical protein